MTVLALDDVNVYYGTSHILRDVSIAVDEGEAVAYLGNNGAGKTTTFKAIMGLVPIRSGEVLHNGKNITDVSIHDRANRGLGFVPGDRRLFSQLTVEENLVTGQTRDRVSFEDQLTFVYDLFPVLRERRSALAEDLSGGQQQMVAIGRTLMNDPEVLLLDEPTEGLAPQVIETVLSALRKLKHADYTLIIIEHNLSVAFEICERGYVLQRGEIALSGPQETIEDNLSSITGFGGGS